jgi:hypothetical protein
MKHAQRWALSVVAVVVLGGCNVDRTVAPVREVAVSSAAALAAKTATLPVTPTVSGTSWDWSLAPKYRFALEVDADGILPLVISGAGFGTTRGGIAFSNGSFSAGDPKNIAWSDRTITFYPVSLLSATPDKVVTITITRADGSRIVIPPVNLVPSIRTRVYGQCTWWTALRRIQTIGRGAQSGGTTSSAYTGNVLLDANYVPAKYDVWMARQPDIHQAFVEAVTSTILSDNNAVRLREYVVTMSQYNSNAHDEKLAPSQRTTLRVAETYDRAGRVTSRTRVKGFDALVMIPSISANAVWR